jgi:membrane-bound lytic murein transglycosylase F
MGLAFTTIAMNGCDAVYLNEAESLAQVRAKKEIVVLTTQSPLIYSQARRGEPFGIDHDLLQSFASSYGIKLRFVVLPDEESVLRALAKNEGDIAAARLRSPEENSGFLTGPAYEDSALELFCHRNLKIQNIKDLSFKRLALSKKDDFKGLSQRLPLLTPTSHIEIISNQKNQDLFTELNDGKHDCVIAEALSGSYQLRLFPDIERIAQMSSSYSLSWMLTAENRDLLLLMQAWFQKASREDEIMRVLDRYKNYLTTLSAQDLTQFFKNSKETLPIYRKAFKEAGARNKLPWQLIASVAYQESHWNPDARSFTGVLGMMQLTNETAEHMGVEDRTDPWQSIRGGSKYLRFLLNKMPKDVNPKDRLALALAAYNIGIAHLWDAQKLAVQLGRNPNSWYHLKEILPLLADPDYAEYLAYGPARGYETVDFVERVKAFYNLMTVSN